MVEAFFSSKTELEKKNLGRRDFPPRFPPCGFARGHEQARPASLRPGRRRLAIAARPSPLGRRRSSSSLLSTPTFSDASVLRSQQRAPTPSCSDAIVLRRHRRIVLRRRCSSTRRRRSLRAARASARAPAPAGAARAARVWHDCSLYTYSCGGYCVCVSTGCSTQRYSACAS